MRPAASLVCWTHKDDAFVYNKQRDVDALALKLPFSIFGSSKVISTHDMFRSIFSEHCT